VLPGSVDKAISALGTTPTRARAAARASCGDEEKVAEFVESRTVAPARQDLRS
jgi:hypothetical protein